MPEPTESTKKIAELLKLRADPNSDRAAISLRSALADRSHLLVAKAAELCGELGKSELLPDLLTAYQRMFVNPLFPSSG